MDAAKSADMVLELAIVAARLGMAHRGVHRRCASGGVARLVGWVRDAAAICPLVDAPWFDGGDTWCCMFMQSTRYGIGELHGRNMWGDSG